MTVKKLIKLAEKQGWRVRVTKRGHVLFYPPKGTGSACASGTPSDHRTIKNTVADLKRLGLKIPTK